MYGTLSTLDWLDLPTACRERGCVLRGAALPV